MTLPELHAAKIKLRYADTILKAKIEKCRTSVEKERVVKRQCTENARLEALVHAADLKAQREASRLALLAVEKSVVIDDNIKTFKELKTLCCGVGEFSLEGLGLVLKKEYNDEDDDEYEAVIEAENLRAAELKKEREAFRLAISNVKKTVDLEDNLKIIEEFEGLFSGVEYQTPHMWSP